MTMNATTLHASAVVQRCVPPQWVETEYAKVVSNNDTSDTCSIRAVYVDPWDLESIGDESYHLCLTEDGFSWIDYSAIEGFGDIQNEFFENASYDCDTRRFLGQVMRPPLQDHYDFRLEFDVDDRWSEISTSMIVGKMDMYNLDYTPVMLQITWQFPGTRTKVLKRLEIGGGSSSHSPSSNLDIINCSSPLAADLVNPQESATLHVGAPSDEEKMDKVHIVLIAASGAFIIAIVALSVCVCVLKKRLNRAQQTTQLMRTTSEPYGRMPVALSMTAPVAGVPIDDPSTLEKAKEVETVKDIEVLAVKPLDVEKNIFSPLDGV